MIQNIIVIILKTLCRTAIRLIALFYLWNYAIAPRIGLPVLPFITIFHIWLAYNFLVGFFHVEEELIVPIDGEDQDDDKGE